MLQTKRTSPFRVGATDSVIGLTLLGLAVLMFGGGGLALSVAVYFGLKNAPAIAEVEEEPHEVTPPDTNIKRTKPKRNPLHKYIPRQATLVYTIHFDKVRKSPWATERGIPTFAAQLLGENNWTRDAGVHITEEVQIAQVAMSPKPREDGALFIFHGKISLPRIQDRMNEQQARTVSENPLIYELKWTQQPGKKSDTLYVAPVNEKVCILASDQRVLLDEALKGVGPSEKMRRVLALKEARWSMWVAMLPVMIKLDWAQQQKNYGWLIELVRKVEPDGSLQMRPEETLAKTEHIRGGLVLDEQMKMRVIARAKDEAVAIELRDNLERTDKKTSKKVGNLVMLKEASRKMAPLMAALFLGKPEIVRSIAESTDFVQTFQVHRQGKEVIVEGESEP